MKEQDELSKQIPQTDKEFRFANLLIKVTHSEKGSIGMMIKNIEKPYEHYTIVPHDGKANFHRTIEGTKYISKFHEPVDYEKFLLKIGQMLEDLFKNSERLDLTDSRFVGKRVILLLNTRLLIDAVTPKKVVFDQDVDYDEVLFENIDVAKNGIGAIFDDNENEICAIFVKDGNIFKLDFDKLETEYEFGSIMKPIRE